MTKLLKKNLKKQVKPIMFFLMKKEKQTMINLDTQLFKGQEDKEDLVILIFHPLFLTFLKMYLEILETWEVLALEVHEEEVDQIKVMT